MRPPFLATGLGVVFLVLAAGGAVAPSARAFGLPIVAPMPPPRPNDNPPDIPIPPPRPAGIDPGSVAGPPMPPQLGPPMPPAVLLPPAAVAPPVVPPPSALDAELVCAALLASGKVVARASEPVRGQNGCGIAAPIELSAILIAPKRQIAFRPAVAIDCGLGGALADWVRDDLAPAFDKAGAILVALADTSGYACRGRNQVIGAKLSEHGKGNAADIGGFALADRTTIGVKSGRTALLAEVKRTACARFSTVLGPGSDGFHESHMHVDLEPRRNGGKICHWDLPQTPPAAAMGRAIAP